MVVMYHLLYICNYDMYILHMIISHLDLQSLTAQSLPRTEKGIYILTELITGGQLYEQMRDKMGAVSRRHAQFYIGSLVMVLEALHMAGVAYRDLKPENVMLDAQGYLKLVDFGLAKDLMDGSKTFTVVGTAPEPISLDHGFKDVMIHLNCSYNDVT